MLGRYLRKNILPRTRWAAMDGRRNVAERSKMPLCQQQHYQNVSSVTSEANKQGDNEQFLISQIYMHSNFPTKPVNLSRLYHMIQEPVTVTDIVNSARSLQEEVPVRLARRVVELESLPSIMADHPSIEGLKSKLVRSFAKLKEAPEVKDEASEREYMILQRSVRDEHQDMYNLLVEALVQNLGDKDHESSEVTSIIDGFYSSRISIRMLIDHHNAIKRQREKEGDAITGIIDRDLRPIRVIEDMISDVRSCCESNFGISPEIRVDGTMDFSFSYIRDHLERIMYAILLNAARATAKFHIEKGDSSDENISPVDVFIAGNNNGCTVRVGDRGGSIVDFQDVENLFKYAATSSHSVVGDSASSMNDPLSGSAPNIAGANFVSHESSTLKGFGLPVSRLYARYFGGDLKVIPLGSYGNETYVHLRSLA